MAFSKKLEELFNILNTMAYVLDSVQQKLVMSPKPPAGSDELQTLLDWQSNFNQEMKKIRDLIVEEQDKMDEIEDEMDDEDMDDEDMDDEDMDDDMPMMSSTDESAASNNPDDYLVVEDREKPSTWHLQVKRDGKPDHNLMGGAWAALHGGYRGNKYQGPKKREALRKLKTLYKKEKMTLPSEN